MGINYSFMTGASGRTKYRFAVHNFNAGVESQEKISSSVKYSFSTESEYSFSQNLRGGFEAGFYFGDSGGMIAYFGLGFGFNS